MNKIRFSFLLSFELALIDFLIFYPGIFSMDSIHMYIQAATGEFSDIHSVFLPIMAFLVLKIAGGVDVLIFLACLFGFFGVWRLTFAILRFLQVRKNLQEWVVCFILLVFASPLTPFPVYLVTLWTDTWLAIFLLWLIASFFELSLPEPKTNHALLFRVSLLITLILLIRSNTFILYPVLAAVTIILTWNGGFSRKALGVAVICPFLIYLSFQYIQYKVIKVDRYHTERVAFALDLASIYTYDPSICENADLQTCRIFAKGLPSGFQVGQGAIDHTLNQSLDYADPVFVELIVSPNLADDLLATATRHPGTYVVIKCLNFWDYIRPRDQYYYQSFIYPNSFGLVFNEPFGGIRDLFLSALHRVYRHPLLRFLSFVHLPWIAIDLACIAYCLAYRKRSAPLGKLGLIFLVPASYSFSYLIVLTASDFRFIYPSLVLMQVITLTFCFSFVANRVSQFKDRVCNLGEPSAHFEG